VYGKVVIYIWGEINNNKLKMDMSLEDLIAEKKIPFASKGRGRGRGRGGSRGGSFRGSTAPGRGRGSSNNGSVPFSRSVPRGQWSHDMYQSNGTRSAPRSNPPPLMSMSTNTNSSGPVKVIITNLHPQVTDSDIRELFGEFGSLMSASVHFDSNGTSLGSAQVYYSKWASAVRAKQQYNGVHLDRRPMRVSIEGESTAGVGGQPMVKRLTNTFSGAPRSMGGAPRGRGAPRGGPRGRGGRGGSGAPRTEKKNKSAEELDAELDSYLSEAKGKK